MSGSGYSCEFCCGHEQGTGRGNDAALASRRGRGRPAALVQAVDRAVHLDETHCESLGIAGIGCLRASRRILSESVTAMPASETDIETQSSAAPLLLLCDFGANLWQLRAARFVAGWGAARRYVPLQDDAAMSA